VKAASKRAAWSILGITRATRVTSNRFSAIGNSRACRSRGQGQFGVVPVLPGALSHRALTIEHQTLLGGVESRLVDPVPARIADLVGHRDSRRPGSAGEDGRAHLGALSARRSDLRKIRFQLLQLAIHRAQLQIRVADALARGVFAGRHRAEHRREIGGIDDSLVGASGGIRRQGVEQFELVLRRGDLVLERCSGPSESRGVERLHGGAGRLRTCGHSAATTCRR